MPADALFPFIASLLLGVGVFVFAWTILRALGTDDLAQDDEWRYDVSRINELRKVSPLYRGFFPIIQPFAALNRRAFREQLPEINRQILAAGHGRYWTAEEWLAEEPAAG